MAADAGTAAVTRGLRAAGWIQDPDTGAIRSGTMPNALPSMGGAFIRSPLGILHEVSAGSIQPLAGRYHVVDGEGGWRPVTYRDGRMVDPRTS